MPPAPTITGRPLRRGLRSCSIAAKNASMSTWRMVEVAVIELAPRREQGHFIPCAAIEDPARFLLAHSAPLLEEERRLRASALLSQVPHPQGVHGPCAVPALAANDDP